MLKHLVYIIGLVVGLTACGGDYVYRINGELSNLEDQTIYAVFEKENYKLVDTITCSKPGVFEFRQNEVDFQTATLFFESKEFWVTAYLEAGKTVKITGDAHAPSLIQVKGGRVNNELTEFKKDHKSLLKELADLTNTLTSKNFKSSEQETDITARLADVNMRLKEAAIHYVKENPEEEASPVLIQYFFSDPDDTRKIEELLALLSPELKDNYLVKQLEQYNVRAKRTALGAEAPDFSIKNIYGKPVSLDSFPDKYLLLTFTAPWCDMCQTEDLFLDKVATTYPKDKLDILLISLDDDSNNVRKVLAKDSIDWNLVTDSAGQASVLLDLYNVSVLPRCFLIDENHKILMKTENGIEVRQTLENLFEE